MVRHVVGLALCAVLAGCGGAARKSVDTGSSGSGTGVVFARGPILEACLAAGRKQATRQRCGCVQAVADLSLSRDEQRRGAAFFEDPQGLQDLRMSNSTVNAQFWDRWKSYGSQAENLCG